MSKLINYMSCVLLLIVASYTLYGSIALNKWDEKLYSSISFVLIFAYSLIMFYKENSQNMTFRLYHTAATFDSLVRIVALPFVTTQVLIGLGFHPKGNYVPALIGGLLGLYENVMSEELIDMNNFLVYTSAFVLAAVSYTKQKIMCCLAGVVFAIGEYCATKSRIRFHMMPYAIFNYFLAGFTLLAYHGLLDI